MALSVSGSLLCPQAAGLLLIGQPQKHQAVVSHLQMDY